MLLVERLRNYVMYALHMYDVMFKLLIRLTVGGRGWGCGGPEMAVTCLQQPPALEPETAARLV